MVVVVVAMEAVLAEAASTVVASMEASLAVGSTAVASMEASTAAAFMDASLAHSVEAILETMLSNCG